MEEIEQIKKDIQEIKEKNVVVPTLGFVLSTASIPFFKKIWLGKK